ncbi:MAG: stage V sporulation protein AC [Oscillospiraceae bacterium]|nr:stage V sporulation protein AC [Oscillospiraceae bacterium]
MLSKSEYQKIVTEKSKKSKIWVNCLMAFLIGGGICLLGQILTTLYIGVGLEEKAARTVTSVSLVFLGVLFTAIGCYDDIAKHAGAGTLVPITGFANSVASPAIEFKAEGFVLGLGAKMFVIAGPVIVYGVSASIIYGVILWILSLFGIKLY